MPTFFSLTHRSVYSYALKHVYCPRSTTFSHLYSRQTSLLRAMSTTIRYGKLQQNKQPLQAYLIIGEKSKLTSANQELVKVLPKDFADANIVHVADLVKEGKQEVAAQWVGKGTLLCSSACVASRCLMRDRGRASAVHLCALVG